MTLSNACTVHVRPAVLLRYMGCACVQGEGLELFVAYLRRLVGERAKEDYSALVENTGERAAGQAALQQCFVVIHGSGDAMTSLGCDGWVLDDLLPAAGASLSLASSPETDAAQLTRLSASAMQHSGRAAPSTHSKTLTAD